MSNASIDEGALVFTPAANAHGSPYLTFTFKVVEDDSESEATHCFRIDMESVGDRAVDSPTIAGTARTGETVRAVVDGSSDADGREVAVFDYSWSRIDSEGTEAPIGEDGRSSPHTLTDADVGGKLGVSVAIFDDHNRDYVRLSDAWSAEDAIEARQPTLAARLENVRESHDGSDIFTLNLTLSAEAASISYRTVQDGLLDVSGGEIVHLRRAARGANAGWSLRVRPSSEGDVGITLPGRACGDANALFRNGEGIAQTVVATVPYEGSQQQQVQRQQIALTGAFSGAPEEHDGSSRFTCCASR